MSARLTIEYDGSAFAGWARQPGLRTVQETLEDALEVVLRREAVLTVAGRTDRGVHARGQVASHDGDAAPADALNGVLPPDVRVVASEPAADGFDARRDALSRTYRYRVFTRRAASPFERGRAWHRPRLPGRDELDRMAATLVGTHDFTAFTPTQTAHVRFERDVMRAEWRAAGDHVVEFWIEADTFMRHMVRALVGTMLSGRHDAAALDELLGGRPRVEAGDTAPPHGLYLESVRY
ncbi:MAG: tRNA pseudouridine38-40 synthase [Thermoleophilaceae bacterium]|nr:tRNA pseudouridine38-40 synthase [Thermoleophilaceae bacterium]